MDFLVGGCMRDLVPQTGMEPVGLPALRARSLIHWTTREVPWIFIIVFLPLFIPQISNIWKMSQHEVINKFSVRNWKWESSHLLLEVTVPLENKDLILALFLLFFLLPSLLSSFYSICHVIFIIHLLVAGTMLGNLYVYLPCFLHFPHNINKSLTFSEPWLFHL